MRNDVKLDGWTLTATGPESDRFLESVFFTGSGHIGSRGVTAFRTEPRPLDCGLFVAGIFDRITEGSPITDFAALPTPVWADIELGGGRHASICSEVTRTLNLRTGELRFDYDVAGGAHVTERRLFSLADPGYVFERFEISSETPVTLTLGVDDSPRNCPIPDDQVKENSEVVQMFRAIESSQTHRAYLTRFTGLRLDYYLSFSPAPAGFTPEGGARFTGRTLRVDCACRVSTSRDADPRLRPLSPDEDAYDAALSRAAATLTQRWAECEVKIGGDSQSESALRYVMYQLMANCPARDGTVSIGARGLTHTRYKGCCFWDTDMFLMPFYLLTDPESARNLLEFRIRTLPAAREHAKKMNGTGARYPWMVSLDGSEQCESWDIGCSEVHVTADIAYAAGQYLDWTGDEDFLLRGGAELLIETARFWPSRYSPVPGGGVNLLFCKGPDEYCGITSNNLYTNCMVRHNIALARSAAGKLNRMDPAQLKRLGVTPEELASLASFAGKIKLPRDERSGRWLQDDTFHLLEPVDITAIKPDDSAAYSRVCFDALQRLKVIKQADVLLLMSRFPERFTQSEKLAAWEDFEPLCIHDSTLSFATHALFAAQCGLTDEARRYFDKALWLDLRSVMGNTGKEGLHLACLGETYQAVVFGFAGLHIESERPTIAPNLPAGWSSLEFPFYFRGKRYFAQISPAYAKSCLVSAL